MRKPTLYKEILIIFFSSISFTILFSFLFIHFLYSELYVSRIENEIIYQGERTASHYHYGELSDEIIQKIEWYNFVSEYEIIVVDNLEKLTSTFPYKIDYESLVDNHDRKTLEQGKYVKKDGYVEELNQEILGAIFPIQGKDGLIGFIYIYVPLTAVNDVFSTSIPVLLVVGTIFFLILFLAVNHRWKTVFKPLDNLQQLAREVSYGNYSNQLPIEREDEIGQLTKAFNQMTSSLAQQEERKKEFTSNIVHELRTPITYISGYTNALKQGLYESPEEAKNYLITINKETERLNKLINDLADLNHLQENLYRLDIQPIVLAQLLWDTIALFDILIKHEKKLHLDCQVEEDLIVQGDPKRLNQVFYNTIENAIKYSPVGGTISITLQKVHDTAEFQINNSGSVIEEEEIHRIGERFYRTDKARTRSTGGTGLGLSIVKEIIRLHDGHFTITSDALNGTTVTIQIPLLSMEDS